MFASTARSALGALDGVTGLALIASDAVLEQSALERILVRSVEGA
ncbi:hypothetical protein [Rothia halotolerans]|nr:hypothetical protein [Rothia halotolerans]